MGNGAFHRSVLGSANIWFVHKWARMAAKWPSLYMRIKFSEWWSLEWIEVVKPRMLKEVLFKLGEWVAKWQMHFNVCKCNLMPIGARNQNFSNGLWIVTDPKRNVVVLVDSLIKKMLIQWVAVLKKINFMLVIIKKEIDKKQPILLCHCTNKWWSCIWSIVPCSDCHISKRMK